MKRAFEESNLRWNPFGEATREDRIRLAVVRVAAPPPGGKLQILGDAGHGKSSSLLALKRELGARYLYVVEPRDGPPPVDLLFRDDDALLVDEAQRLPGRVLRALFARPGTLVLGTHDDLARHAGPGLVTVRLVDVQRATLAQIVSARLEWARRAPGPVPRPTAALLDALVATHHADLRAMEGELYARYQRHSGVHDVEV